MNKVKETTKYIETHIRSCWSTGGESGKLIVLTNVKSGKTEVIVEHTISEHFKIQDLEKATDLYERLHCGGGRKMYKLNDIAHHFNPENIERPITIKTKQ